MSNKGVGTVIGLAVGLGVPLLGLIVLTFILLIYWKSLNEEKKRRGVLTHGGGHKSETPTKSSSGTESRPKSLKKEANVEGWLIPYEDIKIHNEVGRGASGTVSYATWRMQHCAVKQLLATVTEKDIEDFNQEAKLLMNLRPHANVVQFYGVCQNPFCIVTEFLSGGSLSAYLRSAVKIDLEKVLTWAIETAAGMIHLHAEGVIHRELAARNLLLDPTLSIKITDFGMSRIISSQEGAADVTKSDVGPLKWMAPECILEKQYSQKSDVYAIGITMIELLTRQEPYPGQSAVSIAIGVTRDNLRPSIPEWTPPQLAALIQSCWVRNREERPDMKKVYNDLYLIADALEQKPN